MKCLYGVVRVCTDKYGVCMDMRSQARRVAANVAAAISGLPLASVAEAADMHEDDLMSRLNGDEDFTVNDRVRVGGFLRSPAARFMEGVATC